MGVGQVVDALDLDAGGGVALARGLGDAVEQQVAECVGGEGQRRIAGEQRGLDRRLVQAALVAGDGVGRAFALAFVKVVAEEVALAIHRQA